MESKSYIIFNVFEIDQIDFNQVLETSAETLRKSVDGTLTFVKYINEEIPLSVNALTTKQGPYTHAEILEILSTSEWTPVAPEIR